MPQLPSGRHIALNAERLIALIEGAFVGLRVAELMAIEDPTDLWRYLSVLELVQGDGAAPPLELHSQLVTPAPGLRSVDTGATLEGILDEGEAWPHGDWEAFAAFLRSPRFQSYLQDCFTSVQKARDRIRSEGPLAARAQVLWWEAGCHPLQGDAND